jgi:hypothetical protein
MAIQCILISVANLNIKWHNGMQCNGQQYHLQAHLWRRSSIAINGINMASWRKAMVASSISGIALNNTA